MSDSSEVVDVAASIHNYSIIPIDPLLVNDGLWHNYVYKLYIGNATIPELTVATVYSAVSTNNSQNGLLVIAGIAAEVGNTHSAGPTAILQEGKEIDANSSIKEISGQSKWHHVGNYQFNSVLGVESVNEHMQGLLDVAGLPVLGAISGNRAGNFGTFNAVSAYGPIDFQRWLYVVLSQYGSKINNAFIGVQLIESNQRITQVCNTKQTYTKPISIDE